MPNSSFNISALSIIVLKVDKEGWILQLIKNTKDKGFTFNILIDNLHICWNIWLKYKQNKTLASVTHGLTLVNSSLH